MSWQQTRASSTIQYVQVSKRTMRQLKGDRCTANKPFRALFSFIASFLWFRIEDCRCSGQGGEITPEGDKELQDKGGLSRKYSFAVRMPMRSLDFFLNWPNSASCTVALGLTHPLTYIYIYLYVQYIYKLVLVYTYTYAVHPRVCVYVYVRSRKPKIRL
jgi:hypothetical protein